jgi:DNA polymerase III epsilon subunit-like protein
MQSLKCAKNTRTLRQEVAKSKFQVSLKLNSQKFMDKPENLICKCDGLSYPVMSYLCKKVIILDLEHNSGNIVEICAKNVVEMFYTLVNPGESLNARFSKLTGIKNENIKNSPSIKIVMEWFLEFVEKIVYTIESKTNITLMD